jgi:hypothetical protein
MELSIELLGCYLIFLLIQSLFINGVQISAAGETVKSPMGRDIDSEMLLYPLKKYLLQHFMIREYFTGAPAVTLAEKFFKATGLRYPVDEASGWIRVLANHESTAKLFVNGIDAEMKYDIDTAFGIRFYKEYPQYKFSKWIRKPIIQCIICMASFWGFFTYWIPVCYLYGVNPITIFMWLVNTVCLAYVNYLIHKSL